MVKLKGPVHSLDARGTISKAISFVKRKTQNIAEKKPEVKDVQSTAQLSWRHMYQKCAALWHTLSAAEKREWEALGTIRHMTGFAYWQSQCLRPNPGIYLPLQGGTMQGIIDMDGYAMQDLLDPINPQDADTEAARDAAIAAAIGGSLTCDIHGYDGTNWQKLLVESAAQHNLRVKLYDGANAIYSEASGGAFPDTNRGLFVKGACYGWYANTWLPFNIRQMDSDNVPAALWGIHTISHLYGFDGTDWDRLRTYGTGVLKVAKGDISPSRIRMTATGRVGIAGAKKLFWIACSPDGANAEWEITDADAGGGAVVYDHFDTDKHSDHLDFNPPMEFATGIWVEKFDHIKSLVFCYK